MDVRSIQQNGTTNLNLYKLISFKIYPKKINETNIWIKK